MEGYSGQTRKGCGFGGGRGGGVDLRGYGANTGEDDRGRRIGGKEGEAEGEWEGGRGEGVI